MSKAPKAASRAFLPMVSWQFRVFTLCAMKISQAHLHNNLIKVTTKAISHLINKSFALQHIFDYNF